MKFLKTFESFDSQEREERDYYKEDAFEKAFDDMDDTCEPCGSEEDEEDNSIELPEPPMEETVTLEKKGTSYKKSGLKNPKKADLNKDKKISPYEKKRGKAIQDAMEDEKEEKGSKGLTAKQKKLPEGLRKAIEKRNKKK